MEPERTRRRSRKRLVELSLLLGLLPGLIGCATWVPRSPSSGAAVREREDFLILRDEIRRLEGRLEGLEMDVERLHAQADDVRRRQESAERTQSASHQEMGADLERRIRTLEAAREKDRQEIVDTLSRQMAGLLQQRRPTGRAETGYEHEVRPGDTLSTISAAYGVSMQAIQDANQISDPNRLRAGQILFIPSP